MTSNRPIKIKYDQNGAKFRAVWGYYFYMSYPVIDFIKRIIAAVSADGLFIAEIATLFFCFCALSAVAYKKVGNKSQICLYYGVFSAAAITLFSALFLIAEISFTAFAFYFAVAAQEAAVLLLPLKIFSEKNKERKEEKELIRYIDGEIKKESAEMESGCGDNAAVLRKSETERKTAEIIKCEGQRENPPENDGINFSHVKSVIERLEYFDLTAADKKQIETLKDNLNSAENFGFTPEKKSKINDGLSGLLKIMSKYGV